MEASPSADPSGMLAVGQSRFTKEGGDLRRFDTNPHQFDGGSDLHARSMSVCILSHDGETLLHWNMNAAPEPFLTAVAPSRAGLVVAVECLCTWSWLADLCAEQEIPVVLGHARSMQAIHGGKATHDTIDSQQIAALLRGGMRPKADVYPAERRGTRALLRRRTPLMRNRSARLSRVHKTNSPYNLPAIGQNIADQANRAGVAARIHDPAVQKTIAVDLALSTDDDALLRDVARSLVKTATPHDAQTRSWLQTVPGIGTIRSLVLRQAIHAIGRLPSVQDVASYARVVTCRTESAGKRLGTAGKNIGHAHLTWAVSAAATLFLRHHPNGQTLLTRVENKHGQGNALTIRAHQLARAVSDRLQRQTAFERDLFRRASRSSAGEPAVSRDTHGMRLHPARCLSCVAASWNAPACIGPVSQSPGV
jgi:transposase